MQISLWLKLFMCIIINLVRPVLSPGPDFWGIRSPARDIHASREMTSGHQYREKASRSWERSSAKQVSKIWSRSRLRFLSSILFHFTKLNTVSSSTIIQLSLYILLLQRLKLGKCEFEMRKSNNIILISFPVFHAIIIATRIAMFDKIRIRTYFL